ncbi:MAG TPA: sugar ABC transporter permease [Caldilineaceae bacterium]|nr:sugar ABC transporter permease [Caldilineaceae bacterium]
MPKLTRFLNSDRWYWTMLLGPALLVLAAVFIYPLIYSFYLSLTAYDIIMPPRFVGLQNYARILSDPNVWNSVRVSLIFTIGALTLEFLIGFGIALILHDIGFGRNWFRTISVIPIMLTPVVIGVVWRMMTNYDFGIFNYFVTLAGFERVGWSVDVHTALPLLIVSDIWHTTGFVVLVLSAGLAQLPEDLFEAAEIDGASAWRRLVNITIPLLQPVFLVVFVFRSYELLRMFDKAVTLTQGGPARATETITFHVYQRMFVGYQVGYSAAVAYLLLVLTLMIVLPFLRKI